MTGMHRAVEGRTERPAWLRYGAAILIVVLAIGLAASLRQLLWPTVFAPFYAAVVLAVWYGGFGPGLISIGLSLLAIPIWVFEPIGA